MAAKTMMVAGVTFRLSSAWDDGLQYWCSSSYTLERTTRGNWRFHSGWSSCARKTPEETLTEARRRELRIEMKRHERELKRIARELGTEE